MAPARRGAEQISGRADRAEYACHRLHPEGAGGRRTGRFVRVGARGTTFPASARERGTTTTCPADVRTVKDASTASSRMPTTSAISSPPPGLGRSQRITTRCPASASVSRTSSR